MERYINIHTHIFTGQHAELHSVGIHPWDAASFDISMLNEEYFSSAEAIGEIGLDYACKVDRVLQERLFERQLELAQKLGKPVVLHCVKAFEPVMKYLSKYSLKAVIFHGFIGSKEQAAKAIERGYYLSFGHRTEHSPKSIEALCATPLDRLFVETDEAEISIEQMYAKIAELRGIEVENLLDAINKNYELIITQ